MKYILANNAKAVLDHDRAPGHISFELSSVSATLADALAEVGATHNLLLTVTDTRETRHEIVMVTAWDAGSSTATVVRARDGTTAQAWSSGDKVEARAGRFVLGNLWSGMGEGSIEVNGIALGSYSIAIGGGTSPAEDGIAVGRGTVAEGVESTAIGRSATATGADAIAIGNSAFSTNTDTVAIGTNAAEGVRAIAIGRSALANKVDTISIGTSYAVGDNAVAIGKGANAAQVDTICIRGSAYADGAIAIGCDGVQVSGENAIGLGSGVLAHDADSVVIGHDASCNGVTSVVIGSNAQVSSFSSITLGQAAQNYADFAVALGRQAMPVIPLCSQLNLLPIHYPASMIGAVGTIHEDDILTRHRAAPMMTLATGIIDLTDDTSAYNIEIPSPADVRFFPDRIDVIIISASTPGGVPAIQIGTDDSTNIDNILSATAITVDAVMERQVIATSSFHGVTNIYVSVETEGTGTLTCRVVVTGYFMAAE